MFIDAHQHIWDPARAHYPWLGDGMGQLNRRIDVDELAPTLRELGLGGSVLVQASDNAADTTLMLEAAHRHPSVVAVVAWVPLDRPAELRVRMEQFEQDPHVVGIRNLVHERERNWLARPEVDAGLAELERVGLPLDFVTASWHALDELPAIIRRHPELRIVIDHLGKPPIGGAAADRALWRSALQEAARHPLVSAKLSGLYSSVGDLGSWTTGGIRPFVDDALALFGPSRLMYGGDWPIAELAGGYRRTWETMGELVDSLSPSERQLVLGGTAESFYRIHPALLARAKSEQLRGEQ